MKPLKSETQDTEALQELGRASVQVVHDLKNQINGLKLYATFLRKRLERAERPADELETLAKLIAGLERAATDTSALVRYGRPLELRRSPRTDLARILASSAEGSTLDAGDGSYVGDFDPTALDEAFKSITDAARSANATSDDKGALKINLRRDETAGAPFALIEWSGTREVEAEADPFRSFAGGRGLRMALAAKIIGAHGGEATQASDAWRVRLPLTSTDAGG
jgi:hypothetical protein